MKYTYLYREVPYTVSVRTGNTYMEYQSCVPSLGYTSEWSTSFFQVDTSARKKIAKSKESTKQTREA